MPRQRGGSLTLASTGRRGDTTAQAIMPPPGSCCATRHPRAAREPRGSTKTVKHRRGESKKRAPAARRPLLVIDGDSFAHRSYHALPKTIMRRGDRPAGAILGFANMLLRLYREERPRAVLVAWDSYGEPTYRHEALPDYQGGREFDDAVIEQLEALPEFVAACGFANAKAPGYEADDFLASRQRRKRSGA